MDGTFNIRERP